MGRRRTVLIRLAVGAVCIGGVASLGAGSAAAGASTRRAVGRVVLAPRPALPHGARLLGPVAANQVLHADLALVPRNAAGLGAYADAVTSTGSPMSGRYLSPGQFAREFGPSDTAVHAVTSALRSDHLTVGGVRDGGMLVSLSGSARQVAAAFQTSFDSYRLPGGRVAYAETSAPTLPASVASHVEAVVGLDDVSQPTAVGALQGGAGHRAAKAPASTSTAGGPAACAAAKQDAAEYGGLTDQSIAYAYGLDGLYRDGSDGAGETIAVYELEPFAMSDLLAFGTCYFGSARAKAITGRVKVVRVDGGQPVGPGSGEAILDLEDVTAMAPDANYQVYEAADTNAGYLDDYAQFVQNDSAQLLTSSWGECEPWDEQYLPGYLQVSHVLFEQAAAQGQTILNALGDVGSDCMEALGIKNPVLSLTDTGDDPWVLGVGGTTITDATDPPTEQVWNDGPLWGAGSGGISQVWAAPAWQRPFINSKVVTKAEKVSGTDFCGQAACREAPDVSAQADEFTGAITIYTASYGGWTTIGGTSSSSPLWAGILADIGSTASCSVQGHELGFVVPKLYAIAANASEYAHSFNDITIGNDDAYGFAHGLYPATKGYDMASGLGSPQVTGPGGANDGLAYNLCNPTGAVPTVTAVDSLTNPGTNAVPASAPGQVTVTGSGFASAGKSDVSGVTVGSAIAGFKVTSPTALTVTLPGAASEAGKGSGTPGAGTFDLTVTLTDGQTSAPSRASTVAYYSTATSKSGNPVVDDVVAAGTDPAGGQLFRVYGAGFESAGGSATVTASVGGQPATGVKVANNDYLTAETPPEPTDACLNKASDIGPGQKSFNPAVDTCQVQVQVTVNGRSSLEGTIKPEYQGRLFADEPGVGAKSEAYPGRTELDYLPVPKITSISVATSAASESGGSTATIKGGGFGALGLSWFNVGPYQSESSENDAITSVSATRLVVTLPPEPQTSTPLSEPLTIETAGSPNTAAMAKSAPSNVVDVTYEPTPTLTAMRVLSASGKTAPYAAGPTSGGTEIELVGTGFGTDPAEQAADGFSDVAFTDVGAAGAPYGFSDATVTELRSGSETGIVFDTLGDNAGIDQVSWCNVSGCTAPLLKGDTFRYYPLGNPSVSSVTPDAGTAGTRVVISGANLGFIEAVYFGTTKATVFANVPGLLDCGNTTKITATAPAGRAGSKVDIRLVTLQSLATGFGKSPVNAKVAFTYRAS